MASNKHEKVTRVRRKKIKINFLGDSITQGAGASAYENCYVALVGKMLGCEVCNLEVGGTRIAAQIEDMRYTEYFMLRAEKMGDADFVFVFGGTNDYGHGDAPIGTPEDTGVYTFYGAFSGLADYLTKKYGREKLCYILPLQRYDQENPYGDGSKKQPVATLREYIDIEKELLNERGIAYLDLDHLFPEPDTNGASEFFIDGLHPNDKGHKLLAESVCSRIRANL